MRIRYTARAGADLAEIKSYLMSRNPRAALAVISGILQRIALLADFPRIGRETDHPGALPAGGPVSLSDLLPDRWRGGADPSYPPHSKTILADNVSARCRTRAAGCIVRANQN